MPDFTLSIVVPDDVTAPSHQLRVRFLPSRTAFTGQFSLVPIREGCVLHAADTEVRIWLPRAARPGETLQLTLAYAGEPPSSPEIAFLSAGMAGHALLAFSPDAMESWRRDVEASSDEHAQSYLAGRREEIASLKAARPDLSTALDFFESFDVATNPVFLRIARRHDVAELVEAMTRQLDERFRQRLRGAALPPLPAEDLVPVSSLQLEVIRRFFSPEGDEFKEAFLAFASGQLTQDDAKLWNGRPNSAFFFLFAEFALAVVEATPNERWGAADAQAWDDAVRAWRAMLPTFVYSQILFPEVFPPYCARGRARHVVEREKRSYRTYRGQHAFRENVEAAVAAMREAWEADQGTVAHLRRRHLAHALHAFPQGTREPSAPCAIVEEAPRNTSPEAGDITVSARLHTMLRTLAKGPANSNTEEQLWFVLEPSEWRVEEGGYRAFGDAASHANDGRLACGPFTVVYDCVNESWDEHPVKPKLITIERGRTVFHVSDVQKFEYDPARYDTFVVVIERPADS